MSHAKETMINGTPSSSGNESPSQSNTPSSPSGGSAGVTKPVKKKTEDFIFGKVIGEGSYSIVCLAKEVATGREYAIKVLEKKFIMKEKKEKYVMREKEVFSKVNHPFFVRMYFTFQDTDRLYFGLSYARRGELLGYINKLGCFDETCTRFYTAEIVDALEHLHSVGIVHRDLKPENILLNDKMHIQITDFGSAKILAKSDSPEDQAKQRRNSFVGTAQYVSPEVLTSQEAYCSQDLWALGCIIYQLSSGKLPFYGGHEYQIFQKIQKLDYEFPEGFSSSARDLVEKLLVIDPTKRLGCKEMGGYEPLKEHSFFEGTQWKTLQEQQPPELLPYLPGKCTHENLWSSHKPGLDDQHLSKLMENEFCVDDSKPTNTTNTNTTENNSKKKQQNTWITDEERKQKLAIQAKENPYHKFVAGNLILKQGLLDKRVGLFARRRMFLLTEGPHLYYVDPQNMVLKGTVPWSKELQPETKSFKIFFVHTPNRTYYLEDPESGANKWCDKIVEVTKHYFDNEQKT